MKTILGLLVVCVNLAFSQGTTSSLEGAVSDPQGAAIPDARVQVTNASTGQTFRTTTNARGEWVIPSMGTGVYRVTVVKEGFKVEAVEGVKIDAGVPATVNVKLELGQLTETIEVSTTNDIIQTSSASVSSTITGRQVFELPVTSRSALDLIVSQPGTQTNTSARNSSINGLPKGGINITVDGLNQQDNLLKSSDGFFAYIAPRLDAVEEVTLTTSAAGADSLAEGAAQIKFVTKAGSNQLRGGVFWQTRNTALNANSYFNTINGLPRDRVILNQAGVHVGGPIKKNKLFYFTNFEISRTPSSGSYTRTIMTDDARSGLFKYQDSRTGQINTVNLYQLAATANQTLPGTVRQFATTPDPIIGKSLSDIAGLASKVSTIVNRIATNSDYNRNTLNYQTKGFSNVNYLTSRIDYNVTEKHHLELVYNYNPFNSVPDTTNSIVPVYPGTGTILGSSINAGQRSIRFSGVGALRSSLSARLTNELRYGVNGGSVLFSDALAPNAFSPWRGYSPTFGYTSGVTTTSSNSRRNTPVKQLNENLSWVKSTHLLSMGASFSQINSWQQAVSTQIIPTISFSSIAANDPVNTGATSLFTTTNFPNSTTTNRSDAGLLYTLLTGRVASIGRSVALGEDSHTYGANPRVDRNQQREWGLFLQDTWRFRPNLTLTLGLRYEQQGAFVNQNGVYTRVGIDGIWGVSGVGNLFKPGVMPGITPQFLPTDSTSGAYSTPASWDPSIGFAWVLPHKDGPLSWLTGRQGQSVLRGGYSIATVREGMNVFISIWGSNQGKSLDAGVSPSSFPANFGAPGSVLFRDATLPSRPTADKPVYPIAVNPTDSLNEFDPNLKMGYVQSWNFGFQRELARNTVMEVRYTGNHALKLWRQANLNEVNIFENGFLDEFKIAMSNLSIARSLNPNSNNFGNQGLLGQKNIPIISTGLGFTDDTTYAYNVQTGQAGLVASNIATNVTRMANLTKAGYAANFFQVNPTVNNGGAYLIYNGGYSNYNALQVEVRRRMTAGLQLQGSYVWGHSIVDGASADQQVFSQPTTFRNSRLDRVTSPFDIRNAFKVNWIYELPFGPGKRFLSGGNAFMRKAIEGWEIAGISRIQSGAPFTFGTTTSVRNTFNGNDSGVVLHNLTVDQLQDMVDIRKTTGTNGRGIIYYLPQSFIDNTLAAYELGNKTLKDLDPSKPYLGPPTTPGQLGYRLNIHGPWQQHYDLSVVKITRIRERANVEFRAQMLNALNLTNFALGNGINTSFGQTTTQVIDTGSGGRVIEFIMRVNF